MKSLSYTLNYLSKDGSTNVSSPLDISKGTSMLSQTLCIANAIITIPNRCLDLVGQDRGDNECSKLKLQPAMPQDNKHKTHHTQTIACNLRKHNKTNMKLTHMLQPSITYCLT